MEEGTSNSTTKKKRAQWTSQQMETAVKMVETGILSTFAAASTYNIPRRTLCNHLQSGSTVRKLGRSSIFTAEQEASLVESIIRLADVGVPMTAKMLREQAFAFCKIKDIPNTFKDAAGSKWLRLFLKRHSEIARRYKTLNPNRAQKLNKDILSDHFAKYKDILDRLGIENRPETIYNIDEKNCRISLYHQQLVLTDKGKKTVHQIADQHAESVTVIGCANAIGSTIPPLILFKGKRLKPKLQDNLPPNSLVRVTSKGSMCTEIFIEFLNHLNKFRTSGPCLVIFDGTRYHLDFTVVEEADKLGITLYCLPFVTTKVLKPMDKSVYCSFEHHWDQELINYVSKHPERTLHKSSFNVIFSKAWPKCMTVNNIMNGFRTTGLYPYNPDAIPEEAFAVSALSKHRNSISNGKVDSEDISTAEDSDDSDTVIEILPLYWLPKNQNATTPRKSKAKKEIETERNCEIDKLPKPKMILKKSIQRNKCLDFRDQELTKESSSDVTGLKLQFKMPLSTSEIVPSTSSVLKTEISKSGSVIDSGCAIDCISPAAALRTRTYLARTTMSSMSARFELNSKPQIKRDSMLPSCPENRIDELRQCLTCDIWFHERSVDLTLDENEFYCSGQCLKKKIHKAD